MNDPRSFTAKALVGIWVGDAFGEMYFAHPVPARFPFTPPAGPWQWTDDTHMALSIFEELIENAQIEPNSLEKRFAKRYSKEPWRGYGTGAQVLLEKFLDGMDWRHESRKLFNGGSFGNGAAMRVAPIGAYFSHNSDKLIEEAAKSALVTHAHPEGVAGAVAVALATSSIISAPERAGGAFLDWIVDRLPPSKTRERILLSKSIPKDEFHKAVRVLGTGQEVAAFDTVPFCLWIVANFSGSFEEALFHTVNGLGDRDTTCAIVGGIIGCRFPPPQAWVDACEPLPADITKLLTEVRA